MIVPVVYWTLLLCRRFSFTGQNEIVLDDKAEAYPFSLKHFIHKRQHKL